MAASEQDVGLLAERRTRELAEAVRVFFDRVSGLQWHAFPYHQCRGREFVAKLVCISRFEVESVC